MHAFRTNLATLTRRDRIVGAFAACGVSALVLGLTLTLFASASSSPWLPNRPEAIAQASTCDQALSRAAYESCRREVVARWHAGESRSIRLASNHQD